MTRLEEWNQQSHEKAIPPILACCGATRFAEEMVIARPFADLPAVCAKAEELWWSLAEADWIEAFFCHPRIGEAATERSEQFSRWSRDEQSAARAGKATVLAAIAGKNREYERRHGFLYLVCASGRSADELLALLERRIENSTDVELREAAEQQRQITELRLRKWLGA